MNTQERTIKLTRSLYNGTSITRTLIMQRFGVSRATATRDMAALEKHLPATRYNGTLRIIK